MLTSRAVTESLTVIGHEIRLARQERGWTLKELAERAGVSEKTVRTVEGGSSATAVGIVFELAWLVGLQLLGTDESELPRLVASGERRLALAPKRVRRPRPRSRETF